MEDHALLISDLLLAAGPVMTHAANNLTERERTLLATKMAEGARLELRIMTEPTRVSLWVHGPAGEVFEVSVYNPAAADPTQKPH